ncbi:hypothetical protein [Mesorhizobium sp. BHbdii]
MSERSVVHSTIVLERSYDASPARVFAAWSDPAALQRWGSPGEWWETSIDCFESRWAALRSAVSDPRAARVM